MARQNRIVVEDATYHLVTRIAHRAHLLAPPEVKDLIVTWMYGIADFCGIDVLAWSVLDNHLHIEADVPSVPDRYLDSGTVPGSPLASSFSMRPRECRAPRWQPDLADLAAGSVPISPAGDSPSAEAVRLSIAESVPVVSLPRPTTGFMLTDSEMLSRLDRLYDGTSTSISQIARRWRHLRLDGRGDEVDAEKDRLCRRMYNPSQFMKTLKQRISEYFNRHLGHSGQLWQGRFYSGIVDRDVLARTYLTAYIDWNAPKAHLVRHPKDWTWSSYAAACGDGPFALRARKGYEKALGCPWEEARGRLESIFAEGLPENYDPDIDQFHCVVVDPDGSVRKERLTLPQLVKSAAKRLFSGNLFSRRPAFAKGIEKRLPRRFPASTADRLVGFLKGFAWTEPWQGAA